MHCWELIDHRILIPYTRAAFSILLDRRFKHCDYYYSSLLFFFCVYMRDKLGTAWVISLISCWEWRFGIFHKSHTPWE
ncbi:hypothetical protein BDV30DRAFT_211745 [Aspergillus minisclerotigenes]|uniref:Uncharacterized protein n=1 Tax=Aspergillus minisclerotigenes TaxID=656917 RepID=A0A5N6J2X9_9EURO|nr:hypothetical protein BDV30DRAFT_211745 [Aspergillus minisclerotigenes]